MQDCLKMKSDGKTNRSQHTWEAVLSHALKNLPEKNAPADLRTQVMRRIHAQSVIAAQPRLWWCWPLWIRIPATALSMALVVAFLFLAYRVYAISIMPTLHYTFEACRTVLDALTGGLVGTHIDIESNYVQYSLLASSILLAVIYAIGISIGNFIYRTVRR
jgi:hypothetical protein